MTWQYSLSSEPEQENRAVTRHIVGSTGSPETEAAIRMEEKIGDLPASVRVLENRSGAVITSPQGKAGEPAAANDSSATILPAKMEPGVSWEFRGQIAGTTLELPMSVESEEEIEVPAGKFRAWYIRGEKTGTVATKAEQWFVPNVGWVKEAVTQRSPTGQLLVRRSLVLLAAPLAERDAGLGRGERAFEASVSTSSSGASMDTISADALQIVARWRALQLKGNAKVRAVWIAEDTNGIVQPDYKIDEAAAIATPPESVGTFTLSRPPDGWAAGKYRVEFYLRERLVAAVRITIAPRASAIDPDAEF